MHTKSKIILLTIISALIFVAGCLGQEVANKDTVSGKIYQEPSISIATASSTDNFALLKPIQLIIDSKSVYRSGYENIPLDGVYKNTKDLLYNTIVSDLQLAGYQVLTPSESQTSVANKLIIKYKEDTMDGDGSWWRTCYPDRVDCPTIKGTRIRCDVELKNLTTNTDIKKVIWANTKLDLDDQKDPYRQNDAGPNMKRVIYFSAFDDFNKQLSMLINSVFAKK